MLASVKTTKKLVTIGGIFRTKGDKTRRHSVTFLGQRATILGQSATTLKLPGTIEDISRTIGDILVLGRNKKMKIIKRLTLVN